MVVNGQGSCSALDVGAVGGEGGGGRDDNDREVEKRKKIRIEGRRKKIINIVAKNRDK